MAEDWSEMLESQSMTTRLSGAASLTLQCLRRRGAVATLNSCHRRLQEWQFDRRFGVDTCWRSNGVNNTTPVEAWSSIVRALAINYEDYIFIDLGSGKGRTLLLASNHPFKKIIGVEHASPVHDIATRNISQYRSKTQKCKDVTSVCMDATEYQFPAEPLVLYLYNPFGREVVSKVLANLRISLQAQPRNVRVIYLVPMQEDMLAATDFLELVTHDIRFRIYKSVSSIPCPQ